MYIPKQKNSEINEMRRNNRFDYDEDGGQRGWSSEIPLEDISCAHERIAEEAYRSGRVKRGTSVPTMVVCNCPNCVRQRGVL